MKDPVSIFGCWRGFHFEDVRTQSNPALLAEDLTSPEPGRRIESPKCKIDLT